MGIVYMSNYAELEDMITYGHIRSRRKYFTGEKIKEIVAKCLADEDSYSTSIRKKELISFDSKYIHSAYPISDKAEYCLSWYGDDMDELRCYKKHG